LPHYQYHGMLMDISHCFRERRRRSYRYSDTLEVRVCGPTSVHSVAVRRGTGMEKRSEQTHMTISRENKVLGCTCCQCTLMKVRLRPLYNTVIYCKYLLKENKIPTSLKTLCNSRPADSVRMWTTSSSTYPSPAYVYLFITTSPPWPFQPTCTCYYSGIKMYTSCALGLEVSRY